MREAFCSDGQIYYTPLILKANVSKHSRLSWRGLSAYCSNTEYFFSAAPLGVHYPSVEKSIGVSQDVFFVGLRHVIIIDDAQSSYYDDPLFGCRVRVLGLDLGSIVCRGLLIW